MKDNNIVRRLLREGLNKLDNKTWYHGTPDVRELEKDGGFTQRYIDIEYIDDLKGWEEIQNNLRIAREEGNEDEYFSLIEKVSDFRKTTKIKKPIFVTDTYSVAKTYADPKRAMDYQNSKEKVLKIKVKPGKGVTINAPGERFRFINIESVKTGFINAGLNKDELEEVIDKLNFDGGTDAGIRTDDIAAIGDWFGFDYIDVIGVLDSYEGGNKKSTVRMVFNPNNLEIIQ